MHLQWQAIIDRPTRRWRNVSQGQVPAGWYHAEGDPPGTVRYWDGIQWVGGPKSATPEATAPPPSDPLTTPPMDTSPMDTPPMTAGPIGAGPIGGGPPGSWASPITAPRLTEPGARIGGRLLDGLIWLVIGFFVNLPSIVASIGDAIEAAEDGLDPVTEVSSTSIIVTGLINMVLIVAYEVFMNSRSRGTFGKRAISAKIVKEDGSPIDDRTAFMRMVPYIAVQLLGIATGLIFIDAGAAGSILLGSPFWIVALIGLIMLFTDSRRQTPWDKVGHTLVVLR